MTSEEKENQVNFENRLLGFYRMRHQKITNLSIVAHPRKIEPGLSIRGHRYLEMSELEMAMIQLKESAKCFRRAFLFLRFFSWWILSFAMKRSMWLLLGFLGMESARERWRVSYLKD